jgi:hypothetical protein
MGVVIRQFEVYLVALDPTVGHEIQKTRPYLVVSPDEINRSIGTVHELQLCKPDPFLTPLWALLTRADRGRKSIQNRLSDDVPWKARSLLQCRRIRVLN